MSTNPAATVTVKSKPMNPKEILPAIPRQKVRNKFLRHDKIAHVLNVGADGKKVAVMTINPANLEEWNTEDCELVHEEPRPLRVGDKVTLPSWFGNGSRYGKITSITAMHGYESVQYYLDGDLLDFNEEVRHATPEEIAQYFTA